MFNALRHTDAIRSRETTSWNNAEVTAVLGHKPEVHRRKDLSEFSGVRSPRTQQMEGAPAAALASRHLPAPGRAARMRGKFSPHLMRSNRGWATWTTFNSKASRAALRRRNRRLAQLDSRWTPANGEAAVRTPAQSLPRSKNAWSCAKNAQAPSK